MQKIGIIAHHSLREDLISMLHDEGVLEVRTAGETFDIDHTEVEYKEAEVQFAITTLKEFADKQTIAVSAKSSSIEDTVHTAKNTDVQHIVEQLHTLEQEDTEANSRIQEIIELREALNPWKSMNINLCDQGKSNSTARILGLMPLTMEAKLKDSMASDMKRSVLEKISETEDGNGAFSAIIWKEDLVEFEEITTSLGWTNVDLPTVGTTPSTTIEELIMEEKKLQEVLTVNTQKRQKLSVELPNLLKVQTFMRWLDEKQEVRESLAGTESTIALFGWIPANAQEVLESRLAKLSPAIALMKMKPEENEETPVLLKNSKLITPFESVTGLYGLPLSHEMDPTRALSPFFILYFALCLTDAGYGATIALIFGITILVTKKSIDEAKLIWLLFFGGIMTFFVSIPFGGWFGFTPEQVPEIFTKQTEAGLLFKGQIWDLTVQSGVDFLQNLSLFLGITHLFFGMFLAGQHKWIHGKKIQALWVDFTAHLLLGTIIIYALYPMNYTLYGLYAAIAILVWGKGYGAKWFVRPIMGLIGLLNFTISMISNGLSYLRILALGLVTGAIASAINQVAVEMGKLFPVWLSIPVIILIFLGGHTVSIALNTLGSFIHSGRLQFIEFFSQFFEGGGSGFKPFKRTT